MIYPLSATKTLAAVNDSLAVYVPNQSIIALTMNTAALAGHTVVFEVSNNATALDDGLSTWDGPSGNWYTVEGQRTNAITLETGATALAATPLYGWIIPIGAFKWFRVRVTAHTSGTATWSLSATNSTVPFAPNVLTALAAGTAIIGDVGSAVRSTAGGLALAYKLPSAAATTNAALVRTGVGRVYKVTGFNAATAVRYLRFYNKATAPVPGTDVPVFSLPLAANSVFEFNTQDIGFSFSLGIGLALTAAAPDLDTTALAAGDILQMTVFYA